MSQEDDVRVLEFFVSSKNLSQVTTLTFWHAANCVFSAYMRIAWSVLRVVCTAPDCELLYSAVLDGERHIRPRAESTFG